MNLELTAYGINPSLSRLFPPKKKKRIGTFPIGEELTGFESLTPSQQDAGQAFVDALSKALQGAPAFSYPTPFKYEGVNPADVGSLQSMLASMPKMDPNVQATLDKLMQGAGAQPSSLEKILSSTPTFGGELGGETRSALSRALSGKFPEEYFQTSIAGPTRETFAEETAPAIREEFAGPGTFWGTARAGAVTREQGKTESNLAAIRGELGNRAQERSLQATATSMNARQNQISTAIQELSNQRSYASAQQATSLNAAIAQLQKQQNEQSLAVNELNRLSQGKYQEIALAQERYLTKMKVAYEDYIRRNPGMAESMQAALSYLGIPMLATYQQY